MNFDSSALASPPEINRNQQVQFKTENGRLLIILPPEIETSGSTVPQANTWTEVWQQIKFRLNGGERFWQPNTEVYLMAGERLLDIRQLQALADALNQVQLSLTRVYTSRRQTAVAVATAGYSVEQYSAPTPTLTKTTPEAPAQPLADPLYLEMTIRSGVEIRHPGCVIVVGDVNPGGSVIADGDILIWGRLRGVAHAGAAGNLQCVIMALKMEATQIRISDVVARCPEPPQAGYEPEVAYITPEGIRITPAAEFSKAQLLQKSVEK
ncbi:MAG: septum site-determining protein MinC [Oscillatoriaceae bacterium SKW80]|nr:septum site-determining protein MinC [Oscillatoriaceae bacterium SKYG93]MCX8120304.1 septum site-determining protein MinC [Oscillatoriaceae bacterium SKW80]MDW8453230.1 septum site-determining protein MinC [Oscillatoriaceae cyanobacterium SKYGB_i_bin93]HIK28860.1 septum site-determining protein MinC [Oscillatoriaceae cyanobacterium M7585_C2015_266]